MSERTTRELSRSLVGTPTPEQGDLVTVLRAAIGEHVDPQKTRERMSADDHVDRDLWRVIAGELGLVGLVLPAGLGGEGTGAEEPVIVSEELGRVLAGVPYPTAVSAAVALSRCGSPEQLDRWLPALISGDERWTLAWPSRASDSAPPAIEVQPITGDQVNLAGEARFVVDGLGSDGLLLAIGDGAEIAAYVVDPRDSSVTRTPHRVLDQTRGMAAFRFHRTPAWRLEGSAVADGLEFAWRLGALLTAAEAVGAAARALEMAVQYAATRYQFGRLIGSYQAISHRCADAYIELELARAAVAYAASVAVRDDAGDEAELAVSLAKVAASDALLRIAGDNIQIHGGIGVTWEHDAHLYLKRARSNRLLFGHPLTHQRQIANLLEL